MKNLLFAIHTIVTISLIALILLQNSKGGLGSGIGSGEFYRSRRGAEKIVFIATITASILFFITSLLSLIVR